MSSLALAKMSEPDEAEIKEEEVLSPSPRPLTPPVQELSVDEVVNHDSYLY